MLLAAVLLASQPLTQRHIDDLSDPELCRAMAEVASRPAFQIEDAGPSDFREWQVDCGAKLLKLHVLITDPQVSGHALEEGFEDADFCRADNIQRFLQRGWRVDTAFRWSDGRTLIVKICS